METHVFSVFEGGDIFVSLEAHTMLKIESPQAWARKILIQHPRAEYVKVTCGAETVATEYQADQPKLRAV